MNRCPKCKERYADSGPRKKTKHHILPGRLFRSRIMEEHLREMLEGNTFDICRRCHDELNAVIEAVEREILYVHHQQIYSKILVEFLRAEGGANGRHRMAQAMAERIPA